MLKTFFDAVEEVPIGDYTIPLSEAEVVQKGKLLVLILNGLSYNPYGYTYELLIGSLSKRRFCQHRCHMIVCFPSSICHHR